MAYRNGAAVRLQDVAKVYDGVEDVRNLGMANGKPAILVILYRQPGANVIQTVNNVKATLPQLQAALPPSIHLIIAQRHHHVDPRLAAGHGSHHGRSPSRW